MYYYVCSYSGNKPKAFILAFRVVSNYFLFQTELKCSLQVRTELKRAIFLFVKKNKYSSCSVFVLCILFYRTIAKFMVQHFGAKMYVEGDINMYYEL